jgi:hypothetical protein
LIVVVVIVAGSVIININRKRVMSTVDVFSLTFLSHCMYSNPDVHTT